LKFLNTGVYETLWPGPNLASKPENVPIGAPSLAIAKVTWESDTSSDALLYTITWVKLNVRTSRESVDGAQYRDTS